jgi:hypothetical protein
MAHELLGGIRHLVPSALGSQRRFRFRQAVQFPQDGIFGNSCTACFRKPD